MTTPIWPLTAVPLKFRYGLEQEHGPESGKAITEFDGGGKLRRRRHTNSPSYLTTTLVLTDTQLDLLLSFYMNDLQEGTRSFIAQVLIGTDKQTRRVSFEMPSLKPVAETYNRWNVPVTFEIREAVYLSETTLWYLNTFGTTLGEWVMDLLNEEVNEHYAEIVEDMP